jgi:hypothetical protein
VRALSNRIHSRACPPSGCRALDPGRFEAKTETPQDTEHPRLLARYIHSLLSLALDAQTGKDAEAKQLDLCRRIIGPLIE